MIMNNVVSHDSCITMYQKSMLTLGSTYILTFLSLNIEYLLFHCLDLYVKRDDHILFPVISICLYF